MFRRVLISCTYQVHLYSKICFLNYFQIHVYVNYLRMSKARRMYKTLEIPATYHIYVACRTIELLAYRDVGLADRISSYTRS